MRIHSNEMSEEDKRVMISKCDLSTLSSQELKELRVTNLVDKDELLDAHEKALDCCEKEKEKKTQRINEVEQERDELKELLERADKTNEYMMEKNCLQFITQ